MSRRPAMNVVFTALLAGVGCNGLLGIEDRPLRPDAGSGDGGPPIDGAAPGDTGAGGDGADGASSSAYAREVIADAPVLYLRFGESGGAVAHDEMHRFDGAYPSFGATFGAPGALLGDPDGAIVLDGQSKIQMPASVDFVGVAAFSVEMWLKIDAAAGSVAFAIDHETWAGNGRGGWNILGGSDGVNFERYESMTSSASISGAVLPAGQWHHVLVTWDTSVERVFYDGVLSKEGSPVAIAMPAVPEGWAIGGQNCACSGNYYLGGLDELAVYDKVLGGERVQAHLRASGH